MASLYEYAIRMSHQDSAEAREALHEWVKNRGEVAYIIGGDEIGDESQRLHFHAVIRTMKPKDKKDENVFQRKGRLCKYLQERVAGFNPVSMVAVKHGWKSCASYAVKEGCVAYFGFDYDPEEYKYDPTVKTKQGAEAPKAPKRRLSDVLMEIWEREGQPKHLKGIYEMLWNSPDTSPGSFDPTMIMRKSLWLLQKVNPEESEGAMNASYYRTAERLLGEAPPEPRTSGLAPIFDK